MIDDSQNRVRASGSRESSSLSEKQGFDIAKSELEKADTALRQAKMELTEGTGAI